MPKIVNEKENVLLKLFASYDILGITGGVSSAEIPCLRRNDYEQEAY